MIKRDSLTLQIRETGDKAIEDNLEAMRELIIQSDILRKENIDIQEVLNNL